MSKDVHLFLLIHGLWGRPSHLAAAQYELQQAWAAGQDLETPQTPPDTSTFEHHGILTPPHSPSMESEATLTNSFISHRTSPRDDLVVVVAEGMTSMLTYDGIDVCASRVAWEVDKHIAELEGEGRRVAHFSVMGYSLGGIVARYLIGLLQARKESFFDQHVPVSFTTIATPHLGVPSYNTFLSQAVGWFGSRLLSRTGEQIHLVDAYSETDPRPILEVMADPKHVWHEALSRFSAVHVYANIVNDNTVPYPSAAIDTADHFVQWIERGLEVEVEDDASGIVTDWHFPDPGQVRKPRKQRFHMGTLPPTLRFRWPYNWLILALFPIFVPLIFIFVVCRFSLDTRRSRRRLQRLARSAPVEHAAAPPTSPVEPASPASPASPIPSPHGLSIDGLRAAIRAVERSLEQEVMDAADQADTAPSYEAEPDTPTYPEPTIKCLLTDRQHRMIHWLTQTGVQRHLAWFPDVANAHAVIVVRDPAKFAVHERGRGVLQHWAQMVVLESDKAKLINGNVKVVNSYADAVKA